MMRRVFTAARPAVAAACQQRAVAPASFRFMATVPQPTQDWDAFCSSFKAPTAAKKYGEIQGVVSDDDVQQFLHSIAYKPTGAHGKYAVALFSAAIKKQCALAIEEEAKRFVEFLNQHESYKGFIQTPTRSKQEKLIDVKAFSKALGLTKVFTAFLAVLVQNGRLADYEKVFESYEKLVQAGKGIVEVEITFADQDDSKAVDFIAQTIHKKYFVDDASRSMKIVKTIDPTILGGFTVKMEGQLLDLSGSTKLNRVKKFFSQNLS